MQPRILAKALCFLPAVTEYHKRRRRRISIKPEDPKDIVIRAQGIEHLLDDEMDIGTIVGKPDLPGPFGSHLKNALHMFKDMVGKCCRCCVEDDVFGEHPVQPPHISILWPELSRPLTDTVSLIKGDASEFVDESF